MNIPLKDILQPHVLLRNVDTGSIEFLHLRDSIREHGILQPVLVRKVGDKYELIDGLHRLTCAKQLRFEAIPVNVVEADENEFLTLQLQANIQRKKTSPFAIAKHLKFILQNTNTITLPQLASLINKPTTYVKRILSLTRLTDEVANALEGKQLRFLVEMAKLPEPLQAENIDNCLTMSFQDFQAHVMATMRNRNNKFHIDTQVQVYSEFSLVPKQRTMRQIQEEISTGADAFFLLTENDTPKSAYIKALLWSIHLDDLTKSRFQERMLESISKKAQILDEKNQERKNKNE